jgi:hypothetical protein
VKALRVVTNDVMLLDKMAAKEPVVIVTDCPVALTAPADQEVAFRLELPPWIPGCTPGCTPSNAAWAASSEGRENGVPVNSPSAKEPVETVSLKAGAPLGKMDAQIAGSHEVC